MNEDQFNYGSWIHRYKEIDGKFCGTVCCAAGWIPKFAKELGFYWEKGFMGMDLKYNGEPMNEMILRRAFGLTRDEILFIFYGGEIPATYGYKGCEIRFGYSWYTSLKGVINRIDLVLHHNPE